MPGNDVDVEEEPKLGCSSGGKRAPCWHPRSCLLHCAGPASHDQWGRHGDTATADSPAGLERRRERLRLITKP